MGKIVLDSALRARMSDPQEQLEVRDEADQLIGVYLPLDQYKALLRHMDLPFSPEEIEQRRQEKTGSSLTDIWKRLEAQ